MDYRELRIVFMGTPEFAVSTLQMLHEQGANIVGVITAPDKPAGRGMQLQETAVKKYAVAQKLHVMQPEKLKNSDFIQELKGLNADLQIVVAFRMLPEIVWNMPPMGTVNLHGSLLPQYRGAAPINWSIINGEAYTGVTTFKLQHEIDTGNILLSEKIAIEPEDNAGALHDKMKNIGAALILETVKRLAEGQIQEQPQADDGMTELKTAPKIFSETCRINWQMDCQSVHNLIRGLSPYPGAYTMINKKRLKIFESVVIHDKDSIPGTWSTDHETYLRFGCTNGYIAVKDLQLEGKRRMTITDFLRGNKLS